MLHLAGSPLAAFVRAVLLKCCGVAVGEAPPRIVLPPSGPSVGIAKLELCT